jgi:hypothetical protein
MRLVKNLSLLAGMLFVIASTASAQKVDTDFDHHADFSGDKTFMWLRDPGVANPIAKQHVVDDINRQLEAKGWRMVTGNADVGIVANGATQEQHTLNTFYDGFPGWRWSWAGGTTTTTVDTYTVGTLVVDLFDSKTKQAIFRGTASDTLSDKQEKNDDKIDKAIEKMFSKFPPKEPKS